MTRQEFFDRFLYVRKCASCRRILAYEDCHTAFCPSCRMRWHMAKAQTCGECFRTAPECVCMPKEMTKAGALTLRKLTFYDAQRVSDPSNRLIYFLKQHPNRRMADFLASEWETALTEELATLGLTDRPDAVLLTGIPRGRRARMKYGFDQSELLARALAERMGLAYRGVFRRRFGGKTQKKLSAPGRTANMRRLLSLRDEQSVRGKYIFLLDDVVTTGASMAAAVSLLSKAGALGVICLCIAKGERL